MHSNTPSHPSQRYWFTRKRYGYGWQPATWEGWLTLGVFFVLFFGNLFFRHNMLVEEPTGRGAWQIIAESGILCVLLIMVCVRTGEKPRWQWGKREDDEVDVNEPR